MHRLIHIGVHDMDCIIHCRKLTHIFLRDFGYTGIIVVSHQIHTVVDILNNSGQVLCHLACNNYHLGNLIL